jgi:hypothetical protein
MQGDIVMQLTGTCSRMMLLGQKGKTTLGASFRNEGTDFRETGRVLCRRVITTTVAQHLFVCGAEMLRFCAYVC